MPHQDYIQNFTRLLLDGVEESHYYDLLKAGVKMSVEQSRRFKIDPSLTIVGKFLEQVDDQVVAIKGSFYLKANISRI